MKTKDVPRIISDLIPKKGGGGEKPGQTILGENFEKSVTVRKKINIRGDGKATGVGKANGKSLELRGIFRLA